MQAQWHDRGSARKRTVTEGGTANPKRIKRSFASELEALAPLLANPQGPIFLDCKINADVAAPFMSEVAACDAKVFG